MIFVNIIAIPFMLVCSLSQYVSVILKTRTPATKAHITNLIGTIISYLRAYFHAVSFKFISQLNMLLNAASLYSYTKLVDRNDSKWRHVCLKSEQIGKRQCGGHCII